MTLTKFGQNYFFKKILKYSFFYTYLSSLIYSYTEIGPNLTPKAIELKICNFSKFIHFLKQPHALNVLFSLQSLTHSLFLPIKLIF